MEARGATQFAHNYFFSSSMARKNIVPQDVVVEVVVEAALVTPGDCFKDERMRVFFARIKMDVNNRLTSLYRAATTDVADPVEQQRIFMDALMVISDDMKKREILESHERAAVADVRLYEDASKSWLNHAVQCYVSYLFPSKSHHRRCSISILSSSVLKTLYETLAASSEVQSFRYFEMSYKEQEMFLKDVVRVAFSENVIDDLEWVDNRTNMVVGSSGILYDPYFQQRCKIITRERRNHLKDFEAFTAQHLGKTGSVDSTMPVLNPNPANPRLNGVRAERGMAAEVGGSDKELGMAADVGDSDIERGMAAEVGDSDKEQDQSGAERVQCANQ